MKIIRITDVQFRNILKRMPREQDAREEEFVLPRTLHPYTRARFDTSDSLMGKLILKSRAGEHQVELTEDQEKVQESDYESIFLASMNSLFG